MSDFTVIETQEAFDAAVKERLDRQEKKIRAEYDEIKTQADTYKSENEKLAAQVNEMTEKQASHDTEVSNLKSKIEGYERAELKSRIAREAGLPHELAERLTGDDEEAMKADAESLKALIGTGQKVAPMASTEEPIGETKDAEWKKLAKNLRKE